MDINLPLSPPVNNSIQISLNDRLDAITFEKIRVANTQLDTRLSIQEKIINKYRKDVERTHVQQAQRLKREVKKIRQKKPDYVYDDSEISTTKSRQSSETGRQRCHSEPSKLCYCRRYYSHHYNVRDPTRDDKKNKESKKTGPEDFFNLKLRLYFVNVMSKAYVKTKVTDDVEEDYLQHYHHQECDHYERSKHTSDSQLYSSLNRSRNSRFFTQASLDYESDDVFETSYKNFKDAGNKGECQATEASKADDSLSSVAECDKEISESADDRKGDSHEGDCLEHRRERLPKLTSTDIKLRKHRNRKIKRRSFIGSGSDAEIQHNENERRKSKHAFEKIFAGLL